MSDKDKEQLAEVYDVAIMSREEFNSIVDSILSIKEVMFPASKKKQVENINEVYTKAKKVYQNIASELSKIDNRDEVVVMSYEDLRAVYYHLGVLLMKPNPSKLIRNDMNQILKGLKIEQ